MLRDDGGSNTLREQRFSTALRARKKDISISRIARKGLERTLSDEQQITSQIVRRQIAHSRQQSLQNRSNKIRRIPREPNKQKNRRKSITALRNVIQINLVERAVEANSASTSISSINRFREKLDESRLETSSSLTRLSTRLWRSIQLPPPLVDDLPCQKKRSGAKKRRKTEIEKI